MVPTHCRHGDLTDHSALCKSRGAQKFQRNIGWWLSAILVHHARRDVVVPTHYARTSQEREVVSDVEALCTKKGIGEAYKIMSSSPRIYTNYWSGL